jgi:Na+-driven multidrug efflux pump
VLDNVFGVVELVDPLAIVFTSLGVGAIGAVSTMFVQRYLAKDSWGVSVAKGLVMGIIAGVPFQVTGTAVGAILLGWAGASQWITLPGPKNQPEQLSTSDEVVDAEVRDVK